jgi:ABC-2 type transport system permease protein
MIRDAMCIVWKEWRELMGERGLRGKIGIVATLAVFGVLLPLQLGRAWIESPVILVVWSWVPMFLVSTVIADAIAGERERHTLETLLASRLSDGAIVIGKIAAAVSYAGGVTLASLALGVVTVNVATPGKALAVYPPVVAVALPVVGLSLAVLVAAGGTLISLRSSTVRQAIQATAGVIMIGVLGLAYLARMAPPSWKTALVDYRSHVVGLLAAAVLLAGGAASAVGLVLARFTRSRLIAH